MLEIQLYYTERVHLGASCVMTNALARAVTFAAVVGSGGVGLGGVLTGDACQLLTREDDSDGGRGVGVHGAVRGGAGGGDDC